MSVLPVSGPFFESLFWNYSWNYYLLRLFATRVPQPECREIFGVPPFWVPLIRVPSFWVPSIRVPPDFGYPRFGYPSILGTLDSGTLHFGYRGGWAYIQLGIYEDGYFKTWTYILKSYIRVYAGVILVKTRWRAQKWKVEVTYVFLDIKFSF